MRLMKWAALAAVVVLAGCELTPTEPVPTGTAYLVRHAEKTTEDNPGLTEAGQARAQVLADRLEGVGLTEIWSTDYRRTRETAAPIADRLGLEVKLYNPRDIPAFAAQLQARPDETVLVVGHSNTTPGLALAMGGDPVSEINEASEYDRLYVVGLGNGASELQRYGDAYVAESADAASQ